MTVVRGRVPNSKGVLVVEDDPTFRAFLIGLLDRIADMEFSVEDVATIGEAINAMASRNFDFVLLDLKLPNGQGIDVVRKLKRALPPPHSPVIVCTGDATEEEREECYRNGVQEYLPKDALGAIDGPAVLRRVARQAIARDEGFNKTYLALYGVLNGGQR